MLNITDFSYFNFISRQPVKNEPRWSFRFARLDLSVLKFDAGGKYPTIYNKRCIMMMICSCALLFLLVFSKAASASQLPALKVLSTPSCSACARMYRILDELDSRYGDKVTTEKINLLEHKDIAEEFKVRYVPYLLFIDKDGKVVKEEVGYLDLDKVLSTFKDAGISLE